MMIGGLVEPSDELLVVVDDLADRDRLERGRVGANRFDVTFQSRPRRGVHDVAGRGEPLDEQVPAPRRHPEPVDEDDR